MKNQTALDVQEDGLVAGLMVVGFHGAMAPDETPAKLGPDERRRAAELRRYANEHGTASVRRFLDWFGGAEVPSDDLLCERREEIALWYCTEDDGFSLLACVHHVVKDAFFARDPLRNSDPENHTC